MKATPVIPATYSDWRHCIEVECGIALEQPFIQARLAILQNASHQETQRFASLYGNTHLQRVIGWFVQSGTLFVSPE